MQVYSYIHIYERSFTASEQGITTYTQTFKALLLPFAIDVLVCVAVDGGCDGAGE